MLSPHNVFLVPPHYTTETTKKHPPLEQKYANAEGVSSSCKSYIWPRQFSCTLAKTSWF